jgi:hypothetical protein
VYQNTFAALVPLQQGQNTITATATDSIGLSAQATTTIIADPQPQMLQLSVIPDSGIMITDLNGTTSFDTTMEVSTSLTNTTAAYAWDTNGDGIPEQTGINLTQITASYQAPGLYFPTITTTDAMGNVYTDTAIVNVLDRNTMDTLLKAKWEGMKGAVMSGNIDTALNYGSSAN